MGKKMGTTINLFGTQSIADDCKPAEISVKELTLVGSGVTGSNAECRVEEPRGIDFRNLKLTGPDGHRFSSETTRGDRRGWTFLLFYVTR